MNRIAKRRIVVGGGKYPEEVSEIIRQYVSGYRITAQDLEVLKSYFKQDIKRIILLEV